MNCNILTDRHAEHERDAAVWAATPPEMRATLRDLYDAVERDRAARSLALAQRRVHRALPMVKRPCAAKE